MAATAAQDRLFLFGLGLTTCLAIELMRRMLIRYRDAAVIPQSEAKSQYITQDVEDSLKLSTLNKLLDSPNYSIQETTSVIICERALHDGKTIDVLLYHITRPDYDTRERGIRALMMIINSSTVSLVESPKAYAGLVKSLEYCITDYPHNEYDPEWDNWHLRDVVEQGCLLVLGQMIDKFGVEGLVKSRFVDRWLVKEPWAGTDEDERQLNFMDSLTKPYRLNQLLMPLFKDPKGRKQLEEAKLLPINKLGHGDSEASKDTKMINGEGTAGEASTGPAESRRRRGQTPEGEHLRRRHREAMVLNDGTRPLGRGDIIERER